MKYRMPKFGPAAGKTFNRDRFLDGTYPTYFAPGQDPGVVGSYKAPTHWRPAGGILTPPQVVWLTVCAIDADSDVYEEKFTNGIYNLGSATTTVTSGGTTTITFTTYFNDGGSFSIIETVPSGGGGTTTQFPTTNKYVFVQIGPNGSATVVARSDTTDPPSFPSAAGLPGQAAWYQLCLSQCKVAYDRTVKNLMAQQRERLLPLFEQVKQAIEAIRPGKTWVRINDLSEASPDFYDFNPCASYSIAPDSTQGPFFGIDFLHLHALAFSISGFPPIDQSSVTPDVDGQLRAAFPSFMRYACWLYGPDGEYDVFPAVPKIPFQSAFQLANGGDTTVIDRINASRKVSIDATNNQLQSRNSAINSILTSEASSLKDYGVTYKGTQSALSDVSTIVAMIADRFGFDADTGKDI